METLEVLNNYTPLAFKDWLDKRLSEQYSTDTERRYRACDFRSLGVPFGESHIDQLRMLFCKLSSEAKIAFREGVSLLHSEKLVQSKEKEDLYALSEIIK